MARRCDCSSGRHRLRRRSLCFRLNSPGLVLSMAGCHKRGNKQMSNNSDGVLPMVRRCRAGLPRMGARLNSRRIDNLRRRSTSRTGSRCARRANGARAATKSRFRSGGRPLLWKATTRPRGGCPRIRSKRMHNPGGARVRRDGFTDQVQHLRFSRKASAGVLKPRDFRGVELMAQVRSSMSRAV